MAAAGPPDGLVKQPVLDGKCRVLPLDQQLKTLPFPQDQISGQPQRIPLPGEVRLDAARGRTSLPGEHCAECVEEYGMAVTDD